MENHIQFGALFSNYMRKLLPENMIIEKMAQESKNLKIMINLSEDKESEILG